MANTLLAPFHRWHRLLPGLAVLSLHLWLLQPPSAQAEVTSAATASPQQVSATQFSASRRLIYAVKSSKLPFSLRGELLWRNTGDAYRARLRYSIFGLTRTQTSQGRIGQQGLAPDRFSDNFRSEVSAQFNYAAGKVSFSANTPDATLVAGMQDRLSVLIQLGAMLAGEPDRYPSGSTLTIPTVGPRDAGVWLFRVVASEPLAAAGGPLQGIKLERLAREQDDQQVEVWLSPQLAYLPARIRITEANGDSIDQHWQSTEPVGDAD